MMRRSRSLVLAGLALAVLVAPVRASDPMGVYCLVEKVVFEPADCPDRAQVWGACAVALPQPGGQFKAPARGYFYYSIPTGKEDTVRAEWADLKAVAGKGEAVGFGLAVRRRDRALPSDHRGGGQARSLSAQHRCREAREVRPASR